MMQMPEDSGSSSDSVEMRDIINTVSNNQSYGNQFINNNVLNHPTLEITEQPQSRGFRFRYACEGPSHGGIQGETSSKQKKTYPTVRINNYSGPAEITVSLVTDEQNPKAHAHQLIGKNCKNGVCHVKINESSMDIQFPGMSIQHVTKKCVIPALTEKILKSMEQNVLAGGQAFRITNEIRTQAEQQAKDQAKHMQLNVVRICFQARILGQDGELSILLPSKLSVPVYDSKSPGTAALKICRMDKHNGSIEGNDVIFLLCDRVQREDIQVRFFEYDEDGKERWEDYGNFGPNDVHRQYAIVFKTPKYYQRDVKQPVNVHVQLKRISDLEVSDPMPFTYYAKQREQDDIHRKRQKRPFPGSGGNSDSWNGNGGNHFPPNSHGGNNNSSDSNQGMDGFKGPNFGALGLQSLNPFIAQLQALSQQIRDTKQQEEAKKRKLQASKDGSSSDDSEESSDDESESSESDGSGDDDDDEGASQSNEDAVDGGISQPILHPSDLQNVAHIQGKHVHPIGSQQRTVLPANIPRNKVKKLQGNTDHQVHKVNSFRSNKFRISGATAPVSTDISLEKTMNFVSRMSDCLQLFAQTGDVNYLLLVQRQLLADTNAEGNNPLHTSIMHKQGQAFDSFLGVTQTSVELASSALNQKNLLGQTPLHQAVISNQPKMVRQLINSRARLDMLNSSGNTALHLAASLGYDQCLDAILKKGKRHEKKNIAFLRALNFDGLTPLHLAVLGNHLCCVKLLLKRGSSVEQREAKSGKSALHLCVEEKNIQMLKFLLTEVEPNIDLPTYDGNTALHLATYLGSEEMVYLLIQAGADTDLENSEEVLEAGKPTGRGETAIDVAQDNKALKEILLGKPSRDTLGAFIKTPNVIPPVMFDKVHEDVVSDEDEAYITRSINSPSKFMLSGSDVIFTDFETKLPGESGDMYLLDHSTRKQIAALLDPVRPGGDWIALAEWLCMGQIIGEIENEPSPTSCLINEFENIDGKVAKLKLSLERMDRLDAVKIIENVLKTTGSQGENIGDSLNDSKCHSVGLIDSGIGSLSLS